jgi:DNA-binding NtrC family response regulator
MKSLLICSQDQLLLKPLYGLLSDDGYRVDTVEHASEAVRSLFQKSYSAVLLDSRNVGMKASEAAAIIKKMEPETAVVLLGESGHDNEHLIIENPLELDHVRIIINYIFNHEEGGVYDTKRDYSHSL